MPPGGRNKPQHRYSAGRSRLKVPVLKERWVVLPVKGRLTPGGFYGEQGGAALWLAEVTGLEQTQLHMEICSQPGEFHFNEKCWHIRGSSKKKVEEG